MGGGAPVSVVHFVVVSEPVVGRGVESVISNLHEVVIGELALVSVPVAQSVMVAV